MLFLCSIFACRQPKLILAQGKNVVNLSLIHINNKKRINKELRTFAELASIERQTQRALERQKLPNVVKYGQRKQVFIYFVS
jgi:hypothetical protein